MYMYLYTLYFFFLQANPTFPPVPLAVLAPLVAPLTLDTPLLFSSLLPAPAAPAALAASAALSPFVEVAFLRVGAAFAASRRSLSGVRLFTCRIAVSSDGEPFPEDELWGAIRYFSECPN